MSNSYDKHVYRVKSDEEMAKIAAKAEEEFRDQQTIELNKELSELVPCKKSTQKNFRIAPNLP